MVRLCQDRPLRNLSVGHRRIGHPICQGPVLYRARCFGPHIHNRLICRILFYEIKILRLRLVGWMIDVVHQVIRRLLPHLLHFLDQLRLLFLCVASQRLNLSLQATFNAIDRVRKELFKRAELITVYVSALFGRRDFCAV